MTKYFLSIVAGVFTVTLIGCSLQTENPEEHDPVISNNEEVLSQRLIHEDEDVNIIPDESMFDIGMAGKFNRSFDLRLVASIEPPVIDGRIVQAATASVFDGGPRAAVSYNFRGQIYTGALDIVQIPTGNNNNLRLRSGVSFTDSNVHSVFLNDDRIWAAHSSLNPDLVNEGEFSAARKFNLNGFNINEDAATSVSLPGFAANSIKEYGDRVYITSGDNAGLWVYDTDLSERITHFEIEDARWVDADEAYVVVLSGGDNAQLHLFNRESLDLLTSYPFPGAETPEAKNTVELLGEVALIAAGRSGTHIMDLNDGTILATIPIPDPEALGLDPARVETNAATADEEFIFISSGEAGVYVAQASVSLNEWNSGDSMEVTLLGNLQFDDLESVNHVTYRQNHLIIAAGLGGVKAVRLSRR